MLAKITEFTVTIYITVFRKQPSATTGKHDTKIK